MGCEVGCEGCIDGKPVGSAVIGRAVGGETIGAEVGIGVGADEP